MTARQHFVVAGGRGRREKRAFVSGWEAWVFAVRQGEGKVPYVCGHCGSWHIGRSGRRA